MTKDSLPAWAKQLREWGFTDVDSSLVAVSGSLRSRRLVVAAVRRWPSPARSWAI